jgi:hypothetical protein
MISAAEAIHYPFGISKLSAHTLDQKNLRLKKDPKLSILYANFHE